MTSAPKGEYDPFDEPPKKGKKKWLAILVILVLAGITVYRVADALKPAAVLEAEPVKVKVATVENGSIYATAPLTGRIQAVDEAAVVPMTSGEVTAVHVSLGDYVSKGTVLFELDRTQMASTYSQAQAGYSQAQAGYSQAQAGYSQAQAAVNQAQLSLNSAKTDYERMKALYQEGAVSQQQYEQVELQYKVAQQNVSTSSAAVDASKASLDAAQAAMDSASASMASASEALSYCTVTAPISGYVTSVNVMAGGLAGQTQAAVTISDTSQLEISTTISEYLITKVAPGDKVDVYVSTLSSEPFTGTIKALAPAPAMGTLTYPATISVEDPEKVIQAGMFAEVQIISDKKENALCIPSSAVFMKGGESMVAVLDEKRIPTLKVVTTGLDNGEKVEITSGLSAGETIVISGQEYVVAVSYTHQMCIRDRYQLSSKLHSALQIQIVSLFHTPNCGSISILTFLLSRDFTNVSVTGLLNILGDADFILSKLSQC